MLKFREISNIVAQVSYKPNWSINLHGTPDKLYIQLHVTNSVCSVSKTVTEWKSGKRYLSQFMCSQEIVGACFGLIKDAEEHEMREWFRYKNASIFNPHLNPEVLVEVASKASSFICRENAMTMDE